jgi:subtilase family serine protease
MKQRHRPMSSEWLRRSKVLSVGILWWALAGDALARSPLQAPPGDREAHSPLHVHRLALPAPSGYTPDQIRHAYGFDQLASTPGVANSTGTGQTIAIVDPYGSPTIQEDLQTFSATFGLPYAGPTAPSPTLQIAYPQGAPGTNAESALETALDVEWAHAIAPGATLLLVVARSSRFGDLLGAVSAAVSQGASQLSMSWGTSEFASETSGDSAFNVPGVTFTAASGDSGAGVDWPAASPYVTAVGGTSLSLDSSNDWVSELAWSESGGGISSYETDGFQYGGASGARRVPDISFNADPTMGFAIYSTTPYQGGTGWFEVAGTSAGAPQWAALFALANANRPASRPLGAVNAGLYDLAEPSLVFHDIVSGNNGAFAAGMGYDLVTGLGSPMANRLVPALISFP